jgi:hypothetical protein
MALRPEPLSLAEARAFGLEVAMMICHAREYVRGSITRGKNGLDHRSTARVALDESKVEELIRDIFFANPIEPSTPVPQPAHISAHLASIDGARPPPPPPQPLPPTQSVSSIYSSTYDTPTQGRSRAPSNTGFYDDPVPQPPRLFSPPGPSHDLSHMWSNPSTPTVQQDPVGAY